MYDTLRALADREATSVATVCRKLLKDGLEKKLQAKKAAASKKR